MAHSAKVPFHGFWLDAPEDVLLERVNARRGDASDADAAVLGMQLAGGTGSLSWQKVDATGTPDRALQQTRELLGQATTSA